MFAVVDEDINLPVLSRRVKTHRLNLSSRWDFYTHSLLRRVKNPSLVCIVPSGTIFIVCLSFRGAYATIAIIVSSFELKSALLVICHTISFFFLSLNNVINNFIEYADFDLKPTADSRLIINYKI